MDPSVRVWFETKDGRRLRGEEYQRLCDAGNAADFDGSWPYLLLDVPVLRWKVCWHPLLHDFPGLLLDDGRVVLFRSGTIEEPSKWGPRGLDKEYLTCDGLVFDEEGERTLVLVVKDCGDHFERVGLFDLSRAFEESLPPQTSIHSLAERRIVRLG